jgi:hypothetical protein
MTDRTLRPMSERDLREAIRLANEYADHADKHGGVPGLPTAWVMRGLADAAVRSLILNRQQFVGKAALEAAEAYKQMWTHP